MKNLRCTETNSGFVVSFTQGKGQKAVTTQYTYPDKDQAIRHQNLEYIKKEFTSVALIAVGLLQAVSAIDQSTRIDESFIHRALLVLPTLALFTTGFIFFNKALKQKELVNFIEIF